MIRPVRAADLVNGDRVLSTVVSPHADRMISLPAQLWPVTVTDVPTGKRRVHFAPGDSDWVEVGADYEFLAWRTDD